MRTKLKYIITRIALWLTPVILLFAHRIPLTYEDRFRYFYKGFFKITPIIFIVNLLVGWHNEHLIFLKSLYGVLVINAGIGIWAHIKLGTFDIGEFFKSTLITIAVIFAVYFSLDKLGESIPEGFLEIGFASTVQVMTLLFPISKIARNGFILTNGGFPPEFLIKALYNYQKDGNLKAFLEFQNTQNNNEENNLPAA
ncbi:hypothetical protein [Epilithonimonas caeni]|uniref:hypothetical protein n=1 Tax=Epilithonimonas caeni TaxID=365343 RepID=UPI0003FE949D|nr:hypothetical protein [Epilithonimonas caeni]